MSPSPHPSLLEFVLSRRVVALVLFYLAVIIASFWLAYEIRFEFAVPEAYRQERLRLLPIAAALKLAALALAGQFGSLMTYFSLPDLMRLGWVTLGTSVVLFAAPRAAGLAAFAAPRGVALSDFMLCLGGLCLGRIGARMWRERMSGASRARGAAPEQCIAIVGAGDAGATLAREFINAPSRGFRPVMFLDDDRAKHGRLVHGVPVFGAPEALASAKNAAAVAKAVIAMPSAPARRVREIVLLLAKQGIKVETMPSLEELASGRARATRIRPVEVQDLLGREPVNLDAAGIRDRLAGRVVLVTGAGGSIGAELCRQIAALKPQRLVLVEQAEGALFAIEQELIELGFAGAIVPLVADILDRERMEFVFARHRPAVVFHAAAHKHVFLMERQPAEAIRNNVLGTRCVAELAAAHGAEAFVFISTDKAINPTSVMGATKRLAEIQLQALAAGSATKFMAVRFGNVLGSSGSVVPIFKRQIERGGPVTVTDPEVTRYFMTIPEAVGLVLQSFVLGQGGEIFVLDMGQPVKIADLARQMIELSGYRVGEDIEIVFTGLKPGEKLFEELRHHTERHTPTAHPRIMRFTGSAPDGVDVLREISQPLHALDANQLKSLLRRLVPEYTPHIETE